MLLHQETLNTFNPNLNSHSSLDQQSKLSEVKIQSNSYFIIMHSQHYNRHVILQSAVFSILLKIYNFNNFSNVILKNYNIKSEFYLLSSK